MAIRSPLWRQHVFMLCKGDADSHDQCEHWSRNDSGCLGLLFLFPSALVSSLATPSALRATSPKRGSATRQNFPLGAPFR